jgi:polyhydroxyalkanoate synthesis regulator protein
MRMFAPFATGMAPKAGAAANRNPQKDLELEELKAQLAAMQAQLAKIVKDG